MAMGKRKRKRQPELWIAATDVPAGPGHPFYTQLNELLARRGFDDFVEKACAKFYHDSLGRPGIPPGVYFRMLLIGYFEGIDSERGIAWRCADSLALRTFLGYTLTQSTPEHSSLSRIRQRIDVETHQSIFVWVLAALTDSSLLKGKTLGIDATTLEANAAMRSIIRKDTGESYEQFLTGLAKASGMETPTREQLAKLDKKRKNKASNNDWEYPHDPDAKIAKMKDGRTHLAHKAEHAVDMDTGAIVAVTLQPADRGDTTSVEQTLNETFETLVDIREHGAEISQPQEAVTDKGYHSDETCRSGLEWGLRTYYSEPQRKQRVWTDSKTGEVKSAERAAVYGNRRRIRGRRGKALQRRRGELVERSFAHCYETGRMRRVHLRGHPNILKRLLIHVAGFNLGLLMRQMFGVGTPRGLAARLAELPAAILAPLAAIIGLLAFPDRPQMPMQPRRPQIAAPSVHQAAA